MTPPASVALAECWVDDDVTRPGAGAVASEKATEWASRYVSATPWSFVAVCGKGRHWAQGLDDFLLAGNYISLAYRTPMQLRQASEPSRVCYYQAEAAEGWTTTFTSETWLKTPMSRAFVATAGNEEHESNLLRAYLVESLEGASSDRLREVASLLTAPSPAPARFSASRSAASPLEAVKALKGLLQLTWREVEAATGIDENTFYYWQRANAEPRPSTVRKLMSVYGIIYALVRGRGEADAISWLEGGTPQRMDLLLAGESERLRGELEELLSGTQLREPIYHAYRAEEDDDDEPAARSTTRPRLTAQRPVQRRRPRVR